MITAARQVPEPPSSVSRSILLVAYGRIGQSGAISDCQEHYSGQVAARVDARLAQTFVELADTFGPRLRL
jgi:hypothetical protein